MQHTRTGRKTQLLLKVLGLGLGMLLLAACNTTKGVGKDVENLGENIQDAAD